MIGRPLNHQPQAQRLFLKGVLKKLKEFNFLFFLLKRR